MSSGREHLSFNHGSFAVHGEFRLVDSLILAHILLYLRLCEGLKNYRTDVAIGQHPFEGGKIVAGVSRFVC